MSELWHPVHRVAGASHDDPARQGLYVSGAASSTRTAFAVATGTRATSATYFGAFPAGHWRARSDVRQVRLVFHANASVSVDLRGTNTAGEVQTLGTRTFDAGRHEWETALAQDVAWLWFDVAPAGGDAVVSDARWEVRAEFAAQPSLTVGITTYDREQDCVRLLARLGSSPDVLEAVTQVVVADQGTRALADAPGFDDAAASLAERLSVVRQPNLGGSGGFSRAMSAASGSGSSHVLLLDDDVDLEPESILRMLAFARFAAESLIVGAQMLSLTEPTRLHSFGERVDRGDMWWTPVVPLLSDVDLAVRTVENTPALSRRIAVDFNGWWMCLIPVDVVRDVGASLPFFIKWDDAEFGLRAAARGVDTVTLPGAALWHMPWTAKDDGLDWQAYFQLRNRIVTALLHGGPHVLAASFAQDLNHILCAQYGSAALRVLALRDVLSGPQHLEHTLIAGPQRPAAVLADAGQALVRDAPAGVEARVEPPMGRVASVRRLLRVLVHQTRRARRETSPMRLSRAQGKWWALGLLDGALVESAAGTGVFVMRRDRATAARLARDALFTRVRMRLTWRSLARQYAAAAPSLSATTTWDRRFARRPPESP